MKALTSPFWKLLDVRRALLHRDVLAVGRYGAVGRAHDAAAGDELLNAVGAPARDTGGGEQRREDVLGDIEHRVDKAGVHVDVGAHVGVVVTALLNEGDAQLLDL